MTAADLSAWLPTLSLVTSYCLFVIAAFENQRWAKARARGLRGANQTFGVFVDVTYYLLSTFLRYGFLVAVAVLLDWRQAVGLLVISQLMALLYSAISTVLVREENAALWLAGTVGVWPLGIYMVVELLS